MSTTISTSRQLAWSATSSRRGSLVLQIDSADPNRATSLGPSASPGPAPPISTPYRRPMSYSVPARTARVFPAPDGSTARSTTRVYMTNAAPQNAAYTYSAPPSTDHAAEHTFPGSRHTCCTRPYCPGARLVSTCHITNRLLDPNVRSRNAYTYRPPRCTRWNRWLSVSRHVSANSGLSCTYPTLSVVATIDPHSALPDRCSVSPAITPPLRSAPVTPESARATVHSTPPTAMDPASFHGSRLASHPAAPLQYPSPSHLISKRSACTHTSPRLTNCPSHSTVQSNRPALNRPPTGAFGHAMHPLALVAAKGRDVKPPSGHDVCSAPYVPSPLLPLSVSAAPYMQLNASPNVSPCDSAIHPRALPSGNRHGSHVSRVLSPVLVR